MPLDLNIKDWVLNTLGELVTLWMNDKSLEGVPEGVFDDAIDGGFEANFPHHLGWRADGCNVRILSATLVALVALIALVAQDGSKIRVLVILGLNN